jgi:hypothetical protein
MMTPMPDAGRDDDTTWLAAYVAGRDVPCPVCSAHLREMPGDTCPHCHSPLTLALGTVEPYLRAWIALAVATCASSGVGAFIIAVLLDEGPPPRRIPLLYWSVWFFAASTPLGPLVVLTRRRFLRLGATAQRRISISGVCLVLLAAAFIVGMKFR